MKDALLPATLQQPDQSIRLQSQNQAPEVEIRLYTFPEEPDRISYEIVEGGWITGSSIKFDQFKAMLENWSNPGRTRP